MSGRGGRPPVLAWHTVAWGSRTDAEIARQLGCHPKSVANYRRRRGIAASQEQRAWTEPEDDRLAEVYWSGWTPAGRRALARELRRTPEAIRQRAVALELAHRARPEDRWPRSLQRLERETGYETCRLLNAARRLGMKLRRRGPGKVAPHYAVTEAQAQRILAFLATIPDRTPVLQREPRQRGKWGPGETCVDCGRDSVQRASRGRCVTCYPKFRIAQRTRSEAA